MRVPGLGRAWYVLRRVVSYVLAFLLFMLLGGIVCGILALISAPLALFGLLVSAALSIYAVFRIWRRTETEWPPEQPSPLTSQLARENTARNPARTAVTSSSLMIGVALVVFVAVFVNGFKDSFLGALDNSITSDLIIQSDSFSPIPAQAVPTAQAVPDVQTATGIQFTDAKINHGGIDIGQRHRSGRLPAALQVRLAEGRVGRAAGALPGRRGADRGAVREVTPPQDRRHTSRSPASRATS